MELANSVLAEPIARAKPNHASPAFSLRNQNAKCSIMKPLVARKDDIATAARPISGVLISSRSARVALFLTAATWRGNFRVIVAASTNAIADITSEKWVSIRCSRTAGPPAAKPTIPVSLPNFPLADISSASLSTTVGIIAERDT